MVFKTQDYITTTSNVFGDLVDLISAVTGDKSTGNVFYNKIVDTVKGELAIQIALAGYKKEDIKVTFDAPYLRIDTPNGSSVLPQGETVIAYRGISNRKHTIQFKVSPSTEIKNVTFVDGLLTITIKSIPKQEKDPLVINIE